LPRQRHAVMLTGMARQLQLRRASRDVIVGLGDQGRCCFEVRLMEG